ncbi:MAG: hypothetical protein ABSA52_05080 [Candidatus Binatia bacterium]|jgi:hypothetical protein
MTTAARNSVLYHQDRLGRWVAELKARAERLACRAESEYRLAGYEPRKLWRPDMVALYNLGREIRHLPARQRVSAAQARKLIATIRRLRGRQKRVETLVSRALHRQAHLAYRLRRGEAWACCVRTVRCVEDLREWLLRQPDSRSANLNAVALGRLSAAKRRPLDYVELGRRGAEVRWARYRERRGGEHPEGAL